MSREQQAPLPEENGLEIDVEQVLGGPDIDFPPESALAPDWPDWPYPDEGPPDLAQDLNDHKQEYEIKVLKARLQELEQSITERGDLHALRKIHASRLFKFTITWLVVVWVFVFLQAIGGVPPFLWEGRTFEGLPFKLSDTVLIAFITSTTASVLGLYGIAAYWLFKNGKNDRHQNDKN